MDKSHGFVILVVLGLSRKSYGLIFIMLKLHSFLCYISLCLLVSCNIPSGKEPAYYCHEANFHFDVEDTEDACIVIFEDSDSVFFGPTINGNYSDVIFYVLDSVNTIYLKVRDIKPKVVEKKYRIKFLTIDYNRSDHPDYDYSVVGDNYWLFRGNCDQGAYTFSYWRNGKYKGIIEYGN